MSITVERRYRVTTPNGAASDMSEEEARALAVGLLTALGLAPAAMAMMRDAYCEVASHAEVYPLAGMVAWEIASCMPREQANTFIGSARDYANAKMARG